MSLTGMMDAACPKCKRRFGWRGSMVDRPACPKCGHQLPRAELVAADRQLQRFEEEMAAEDEKESA